MSEPVNFKTIDEAIGVYVDVRDELRRHQKKAKEREEELKAFMDKISMWLRDKADEVGVDSFKTKHGTAYRAEKKSYRVADWDAMVAYIKETDNFQLLEKRVAKRACEEIHRLDGDVPPGIEFSIEVEMNVLRPKSVKDED